MLLKVERRILNEISKNPEKFEISIESFPSYSGFSVKEAMASLKDKGYLSYESASVSLDKFQYQLTSKGRYYGEYCAKYFFSNIVIPILVSIVTTLITMFLTS